MTELAALTAISPLDGRYQSKCTALSPIVSEMALNGYRLLIEAKWLQHICQFEDITHLPPLTDTMNEQLNKICEQYDEQACLQIKAFEKQTNHDVKSVEYYLKDALSQLPEFKPYLEFIHFACTSEDINNLSYGLMLNDLKQKVILPHLEQVLETLKTQALSLKDLSMLSRTHGQPASPTTLGKEFANVHYRLNRQIQQLSQLEILGKINGAVGNFNAHHVASPTVNWTKLSQDFVQSLGLAWNPMTTQIEPHDNQAEFYHILTRTNTILIDFCRDVWAYISNDYFKQKKKEGEVGSSTMPHKVNPIDFENAEGNFGLSTALLSHLAEKLPISRWQRDLTDSTVQRNIGVAVGYHSLAMSSLMKGLGKLEVNPDKIQSDLDQQWVILGEAIQTVLRQYQVQGAYEKLKEFTRGKNIDANELSQFIDSLDLPDKVKTQMKQLTPANYIGLAQSLTEQYLK